VTTYHAGNRQLQQRFDTERLADRIDDKLVKETIDDRARALIERQDMFFLATADADGRPQCSYKGGAPGFVRVVDDKTLAFPSYDGNGMFLSLGNIVVNPHVGMLFIDFEHGSRLRVSGTASVAEHDPLLASWVEAQLVVRVNVTHVFPNCPRYIHEYKRVERSAFVPTEGCETPAPAWKRREWSRDALPAGDPAANPKRKVRDR
jgi:predicted pyridoxine 5'-phosphate oxidase superfamily flavin-nucleotide-binding protein